MTALRRNFFGRLASAAPSRGRPFTRVNEPYDFDDAASIRTVLPSYNEVVGNSPPPTYYSLDDPVTRPVRTPRMNIVINRSSQSNERLREQETVDELVHRLRDIIKNPATWRTHENGEKSFFWALRCAPGTADILHENIQEIQDRILGSPDFRVEKFCFIFKGQRLVDLWCRPIQQGV